MARHLYAVRSYRTTPVTRLDLVECVCSSEYLIVCHCAVTPLVLHQHDPPTQPRPLSICVRVKVVRVARHFVFVRSLLLSSPQPRGRQ